MHKLSLIVPYRDRASHLNAFIDHMKHFLPNQGIDYDICVVEQCDSMSFNKAKLLNIGFVESLSSDYFCFHDVDLIPEDSDYSYVNMPTHLSAYVQQFNYELPFENIFGGVVLFPKDLFIKINGFSNMYWGWGVEDDDLLVRCVSMGVKVDRRYGRYSSLPHKKNKDDVLYEKNWKYFQKHKNKEKSISLMHQDGLNSLKYKKVYEKNIDECFRMIGVML